MITASIVTYNTNKNELITLLNCCDDSAIDKVYVVDNSPCDCIRVVVFGYSKVEYIYGHGNIGYGAAHNIAMRKSIEQGADYHFVLNPDIIFNGSDIHKLAEFMDNYSDAALLMPRVTYPDGELQYLCKLLPTPMDLIGRRFMPIKSIDERRNHKFEMRDSGCDKIMQVPYLSGCFMMLRVSALKEVGLFDENIFMYCEDIDLSRRIFSAFGCVYYPEVTIIHAHAKESYKSRKLMLCHIKSAIYYFNKWGWIFDSQRQKINKLVLNKK